MQKLVVFQSMWAMERRQTDALEHSLAEKIGMIHAAQFDGVSDGYVDRDHVKAAADLRAGTGLLVEAMCYPSTVDELKITLELASKYPVHHVNLQPNVRKRTLAESAPFVEGWLRIIEQVDFPVYFETHRDRLTTDLFFTLDLMDAYPEMNMLADLSHFLVGREFADPISEENHALIHQVLDRSWAFHGRVASREQVQIEISFPHHKKWVDVFAAWWRYGFRSWRSRQKDPSASLGFTCELGPQPYAITNIEGNDTTDRWKEALMLRQLAQQIWQETSPTS